MPKLEPHTSVPKVVRNPFILSFKNIILGLLIGTTLISSGIAGFYYFQLRFTQEAPAVLVQRPATSSAKSTPKQPTIINETDGWKNFVDSQKLFSVKYPNDWVVDEGDVVLGEGSINLGTDKNFDAKTPYVSINISNNGGGAVPFDSYTQLEKQSINNPITTSNPGYPIYIVTRFQDITVDSKSALKYEVVPKKIGDGFYNFGIIVKQNNRYFRVSIWSENKLSEDIFNTFDLISSNFKFLPSP